MSDVYLDNVIVSSLTQLGLKYTSNDLQPIRV